MPTRKKSKSKAKKVTALTHDKASRKNIPTAEHQALVDERDQHPIRVAYERRNRDLDPQLVWREKDQQDASDLVVQAPPLFIQEKVHPKVLIDDLVRESARTEPSDQVDLFSDFNGLPDGDARTEFYQHDANWSNRMILGDSLQVMASLAEREGLRGKVQCIYIDPPYGIKFNSNFQWSTTSRDVKDGKGEHITREPEQVKAFRDTWRDGVHSYLAYMRDRLIVGRDLLAESGSIFVQIGDENVHRIRTLMDEVFGDENFVSQIHFATTSGFSTAKLSRIGDYLLWYARDKEAVKYRTLFVSKGNIGSGLESYKYLRLQNGVQRSMTKEERDEKVPLPDGCKAFRYSDMQSKGAASQDAPVEFRNQIYRPLKSSHWKANWPKGIERLKFSGRIDAAGSRLAYIRFAGDYPVQQIVNSWMDTGFGYSATDKQYVVQTHERVVRRCVLMSTDPGDLVLDPTGGSGTAAYVAEQWGRRWITIDTSRVALALARARIMGARYPYYKLAGDTVQEGFDYERVPHITLKFIANNAEIDVIYEEHQQRLEPLRAKLNNALKEKWEEWEIPRDADNAWSSEARKTHAAWWEGRIARQKEIDANIAKKADLETLYDKPHEDKTKVRVAGPFTVDSLSPHRMLVTDETNNKAAEDNAEYNKTRNFTAIILENLKTAGVQQANKEDKIEFTSLEPWCGDMVCAEGRYVKTSKGDAEIRAAIFIGPEFGTVSRTDLVAAAKEAAEAGFDVLIACAFNYEAHATEIEKLGRMQVLKARMNADLHMAGDLKATDKGNLFVIFGEPDIEIQPADDGQFKVKLNGVDVYHPNSGEIRSDDTDGIACWFIDTNYNEESFFVRHAYFLGAGDPYKSLKTTLKAEINKEAWETLKSDTSRPFPKPETGRIAVKVINHLGDEVMKVFRV
ncbi:MAG: site-specific DNA-methyltransferase [bacterium]